VFDDQFRDTLAGERVRLPRQATTAQHTASPFAFLLFARDQRSPVRLFG
jgi:hypothetical protein